MLWLSRDEDKIRKHVTRRTLFMMDQNRNACTIKVDASTAGGIIIYHNGTSFEVCGGHEAADNLEVFRPSHDQRS